jgi:hypothetical protein
MKPYLIFCTLPILAGCVGSPVHETVKYSSLQSEIRRNNDALLSLTIGMSKDAVMQKLGKPERSEGYKWGAAWLYRTAMTSGVYGTSDSDFTPLVFDTEGRLTGWGRNFFGEQIKRYEVQVR